jgi:hypothetical protein
LIEAMPRPKQPESPKVPRADFEAVIKALLKTPPTPASGIPRKREPKAKKR